jgi:peroxiredoxin
MIKVGDKLPSVPVKYIDADTIADADSAEILGKGRIVLFAVPGAFTPTCDTSHLPGFVSAASRIKGAGIDRIVCASVNDHHVMRAWADRSEALGKVDFIADAHARLADAMGLSKDFGDLGRRFARFAMILKDGVVQHIFVQDVAGVTVSGASAILLTLQGEAVA